MAYALVGTIGTAVLGTSGAAISPTFGTGESRTVGNLLVLYCAGMGTATLPTTPSGWSILRQRAGTSCSATVYYKIAAGSDTAPTVALVASTFLAGQLAEFSGNGAALDKLGDAAGTTSPLTATLSAADVQSGELLLACSADFRSVARTPSDTWTSNNATFTQAGNNNTVSSVTHYSFGYGNTTSAAAATTAILTISTTTSLTGAAVAAGTFLLPVNSPGTRLSPNIPQILAQ